MVEKIYSRLGMLALVMTFSACSLIEGDRSYIRLEGITALTPHDEAVIIARLGANASALKPSFRITRESDAVVIEAKGAPPEEMANFLLSHPGAFVVKSRGGTVWFSERDITDAVAGFNDQQMPVINLKLSAEATQRVARLSSREVGNTVSASFDDEILVSATISGPITEGRLQLSLQRSAKEVQLICSILKSGALAAAPKAIQFQK